MESNNEKVSAAEATEDIAATKQPEVVEPVKLHDRPQVPESRRRTMWLAKMGVMLAVSVLISFIPTPPILPAVPFIRYEFSDIPLLIGTFAFGVPSGVLLAFLSIALNALLGGAESALYGALMHMIAIGVYIIVAGFIYRSKKNKKRAIIGLCAGTLAMTIVMIPANLLVTPIFMKAFMGSPQAVVDMIVPLLWKAIVPVNLIKGFVSALLVFLLYKRISPFLHKW